MASYRAVIRFPVDGVLPADAMQITPHYSGDDAQALANTLKSNLSAFAPIGATKAFKVSVYDAQKAPPNYPLAIAEQAGTPATSNGPRELALCLSYFSGFNRPRLRGRLYIPKTFISGAPGLRPDAAQMTAALDWRTPLTTGLPGTSRLIVWSRVEQKAWGVDNFWVDDEWDVVRSRGRKPTTRQTATFP
jgi:hypothetical protein